MTPSPDGTGAPRTASASQLSRLQRVHLEIPEAAWDGAMFVHLAERVAGILDTKVAVLIRAAGGWRLMAESTTQPALPPLDELGPLCSQLIEHSATVVADSWQPSNESWTLVGARGTPAAPFVVVIAGDWTPCGPALLLLAENISLVVRANAGAASAKTVRAVHRLGMTLTRAKGRQGVYDAIVHQAAWAVRARVASLAVMDVHAAHLSIAATHGYPLALVQHLRIEPGDGVIGLASQGEMLRVNDARALPDRRRRRPRYRSNAFVAAPLRTRDEVLGVLCVTDREGNGPFTERDVSTLRALMPVAALALSREQAQAQADSFEEAAALDPVTGAFNRRYFHVRLKEELERARRHQLPLALLILDIDDFKKVNDSQGHVAGDRALRDVAEILRRSLRVFDVCARFGGDEFALIMPGSSVRSAETVAARILELIEAHHLNAEDVRPVGVTVSIGLAMSSPDIDPLDLIAQADLALYAAKRAGKNCVRVHPGADRGPEADIQA